MDALLTRIDDEKKQVAKLKFGYDIETDWTLFTTCNYACDYCFFDAEALGKKLEVFASNEQWQHAFDNTGLTWLIHLTGGEPFVLPNFVDLCNKLSQKHFISLNSNLTRPSVKDFAEKIDPSRVSMINASFHPIEREKRHGYDAFVRNYHSLKDSGFNIMATMVGDPKALMQFDEISKSLKSEGIVLVPNLMRGLVNGKVYPQAYSCIEKDIFKKASIAARLAYQPMLESMPEPPTINPFDDDSHLDNLMDFRGMTCGSGSRFVIMNERGDIIQCPSKVMGNLLEGTFQVAKQDIVCNSRYCYYFCMKYANTTESKDIIKLRKGALAVSSALQNVIVQFKSKVKLSG